MSTKLLLTGANGQLGSTFTQHWAAGSLVDRFDLVTVDVDELDLCKQQDVHSYLDSTQPGVIVNAAAYTAVDGAESERDLAFEINAQAVAYLASWCAEHGRILVQLSTDFVFDGTATEPYSPEAPTAPLSVYGTSKQAGEMQVQSLLGDRGIIVRTSWLYSEYGNNFVKTMLRLMREKDELGIVGDQIGSPTSTHSLVRFLYALLSSQVQPNICHWTDGGSVSWFEFAQAIQEAGLHCGLLQDKIPLNQLTTAEYPTAAARPAYSVLDCNSSMTAVQISPTDWREELNKVVLAISRAQQEE